MISVVMVHVLTYSYGLDPTKSALCIIRSTFTLPLFFFVSGFFLFRPLRSWTRERALKAIRVRTLALLCGSMAFATLYFAVSGRHKPFSWLPYANFDQYWYTISLFQIFIYYLLLTGIARLTKPAIFWWLTGLLSLGSLIWLVSRPGQFWTSWLCTSKTLEFFPYFAIGMCVRRFSDRFFALLSRPDTLTWLILCYIGSLLTGWLYGAQIEAVSKPLLIFIRQVIARVSGLLLVVNIFYIYRDFFDRDTRFVRGWRHIGMRTLDIYYLHYFLLPHMRWVGVYLKKKNTLIPELVAGLAVAAVVIALCLAISALLRRAPYIRRLLGAK